MTLAVHKDTMAAVLTALFFGGIDLNIYTLPVILISIGTGIDACIYLWSQPWGQEKRDTETRGHGDTGIQEQSPRHPLAVSQ